MGKRASRTRRDSLNPDEVIAGRQGAGGAELMELIHRVNPTDRGLSAAEQRAGYRRKAALQSLLIRKFGDYVEVEPTGAGTVSIRHAMWGRDAAHAIISELEDDARAWIQDRLDGLSSPRQAMAVPPGSTPRRAAGPPVVPARTASVGVNPPASSLLAAGLQARADYDFDAARKLLGEALAASGGAHAARALLELLVDDLAAWDEAGELGARFGEDLLDDADLLGLLAEAAGRRGDVRTCRKLASRAAPARALQGLLAASEAALARGAWEEVEELLVAAEVIAPHAAELRALRQDAARRRSQESGAAEVAFLRETEGLADRALVPACEAFLLRHTGASGVRRALDEARRRLAEPALRNLQVAAEAAIERGDLAAAAEALRAAAEMIPDDPRTAVLSDRLEGARAAQQVRERIDEVARLISRGRRRAALGAFEALPEAERSAFAADQDPVFRWHLSALDKLRRVPAGDRLTAVLALREAVDFLESAYPQDALSILRPHLRFLEELPDAAPILRRATDVVAESRRTEARLQLDAAERAISAGRPLDARDGLQDLRSRDLGPEDLGRLQRIRETLAPAIEAAGLREEARLAAAAVEELLPLGAFPAPYRLPALLAAAAAAEAAAAGLPSDEAATWRDRADALRAAVARHGRCRDLDSGFGPQLQEMGLFRDPSLWFGESSGGPVLFWAIRDRLLRFDLIARTARSSTLPRVARRWWFGRGDGAPDEISLCDGTVLMEIKERSLELRSIRELPVPFPAPEVVLWTRGRRYVWVIDPPDVFGQPGEVHVVDLERNSIRDLGARGTSILGEAEDLVILGGGGGPPTRWCASGEPSGLFPSDLWGYQVREARFLPGTEQLFLVLNPAKEKRAAFERTFGAPLGANYIAMALLDGDGQISMLDVLSRSDHVRSLSAALDSRGRTILMVIRHLDNSLEARLCRLDGLAELWSLPVPAGCDCAPAQRFNGQGAGLWVTGREGPVELMVDASGPPLLPAPMFSPGGELPILSVGSAGPCGPSSAPIRPDTVAAARRTSAEMAMLLAKQQLAGRAFSVDTVLGHLWLSRVAGQREASDFLGAELQRRAPNHLHVRQFRAALAADQGDWQGVLSALGAAEDLGDDPHRFHMRAVALLRLGRAPEAMATLDLAKDLSGTVSCGLAALRALAEPLTGAAIHRVSALRDAVHRCDQALARGDVKAALDAIGAHWVRSAREIQSGARLAEAHLRAAGDGPLTLVTELALSSFLAARSEPDHRDLPYPEGVWDEDRLRDVAARAEAALERA